MQRFLVRRLIQSAVLLWALLSFTFLLTRLAPGGPETALIHQPALQQADIERMRERFGLNDPLPLAYGKWLWSAARLDFGRSYQYLRPPLDVVRDRLGPTVQLGGAAFAIALLGVPLGVLAAYRRDTPPDHAIRIFTVAGDALPNWWLALLIIVLLGSLVGWFPQGQGRDGPLSWILHLAVPAAVLGLGGLVAFTRHVRSQVLEVLGQEDYVRTARSKGLAEFLVATRHVLPNALIPAITLSGTLVPVLLSGAVITEGIFNWPGVGQLYLQAALGRDYPLLLALVTVFTLLTLLATLAADLLYGLVDPRIRYG